jgi:hypothetical protein
MPLDTSGVYAENDFAREAGAGSARSRKVSAMGRSGPDRRT